MTRPTIYVDAWRHPVPITVPGVGAIHADSTYSRLTAQNQRMARWLGAAGDSELHRARRRAVLDRLYRAKPDFAAMAWEWHAARSDQPFAASPTREGTP